MLDLLFYLLPRFINNLYPGFHFIFIMGFLSFYIYLFDFEQDRLSAFNFTYIYQERIYFQILIFNIQIQLFQMALL